MGERSGTVEFSGYARSKWTAEGATRLANGRGIPTASYRPAYISGHSETGVAANDDALWHYVRACIELGARPLMDRRLQANLVPVDFVAGAFVRLALTQRPEDAVHSLAAPSAVDMDTVLDHACVGGYRMEPLPCREWERRLEDAAREEPLPEETSLHAVALLNSAMEIAAGRYPRELDRRNMLRGLANAAVASPPTSTELRHRYFAYFMESGFLPAADGRAASDGLTV
ncbi:SDR family oxidoreductase [Streptomyces pinistramenti]|uniref:SDR family oxidoreductase n=1 Tax=Streptomyces pinistramenti TaxID=2884812 RepID=UPI003556AA31